jgi:hypothetical protein
MQNRTWARVLPILMLPAVGISGGCLLLAGAAAVGAGAYVYVNGEYKATVDTPLDRAWEATRGAVEDLQLKVKTREKDGLIARLTADRADGTNVWISLDVAGEKTTQFVIRVGVAGDEAASRAIMDKIRARL